MTAWAVGSSVSRTRSWPRATIASSSTATAAWGRSPRAHGGLRLGQRLAHVQLVVHEPDHTAATGSRCRPRSMPSRDGTCRSGSGAHGRRRRAGPELGHQERDLPRDRARHRGHRHSPRLGGPDPRQARRRARPDYLRPLDRRNTRTIDRTGGTWLHTSRTNPARMKPTIAARRGSRLRRPSGTAPTRAGTTSRRSCSSLSTRSASTRSCRSVATTRCRSHESSSTRRAARRDPQDDGQRRARARSTASASRRRSRGRRS